MTDLTSPVLPDPSPRLSAPVPAPISAPAPPAIPEGTPTLLQEFAQWLQQWADRVQAQLAQQEAAGQRSQLLAPGLVGVTLEPNDNAPLPALATSTLPVAPATDAAAAPQFPGAPTPPGGPPLHWLARVQSAAPPAHWQAHLQRTQREEQQRLATPMPEITAKAAGAISALPPDTPAPVIEDASPHRSPLSEPRVAAQPPARPPAATAPIHMAQSTTLPVGFATQTTAATLPLTLATMNQWISELRQGVTAFLHAEEAADQPLPAAPNLPTAGAVTPPVVQEAATPAARAPASIEPASARAPVSIEPPAALLPTAPPLLAPAPASAPAPVPAVARYTQLRVNLGAGQPAPPAVDPSPMHDLDLVPLPQPWPALPALQDAAAPVVPLPVTPPAATPVAQWPALPPMPTAAPPISEQHQGAPVASGDTDQPPTTRPVPLPARLERHPWPDLADETPPHVPSAAPDWRQIAYQQLRRQRLDREQQGTLWNG